MQAALTDLEVPSYAQKVDVLWRSYRVKNGKEKSKLTMADYINEEKWVYCSGDDLCFADVRTVVSIPVSAIAGTEIRSKRVRVPEWNKEQAPNAKEHEPYRVTKTMASTSSARTPPCRPMTCSATTRSSSPIRYRYGRRDTAPPHRCASKKSRFSAKSLLQCTRCCDIVTPLY